MKKISVPSVQFCYEPKSALKQTVYLFIFFKKEEKLHFVIGSAIEEERQPRSRPRAACFLKFSYNRND